MSECKNRFSSFVFTRHSGNRKELPKQAVLVPLIALALLAPVSTAGAVAIQVGSSSLIGQLDYSDTFTIGPGSPMAARQAYVPQTYPLPPGVDVVEDSHGNPGATWGTTPFSIATDASHSPTAGSPYPGNSGAGSDTGFTQRGHADPNGGRDWGIAYGLRDAFVVQTDFVQQSDRVDITVGAAPGNIFAAGNISVFFRHADHPLYPEIGIYNGSLETDTGLSSGLAAGEVGEWHNYAIRVDVLGEIIEVFVDEQSRGLIDLQTIGSGAYAGILNNAYVGVGGFGNDRQWSDNFQVGSVVPEPGTMALFGLGLAGLRFARRKRPA